MAKEIIKPGDKCAKINLLKSKGLNQIQVDLLSSFLVGHWKEISKSEHRVAFERILETLNPGSLQAVKNLAKGGEVIYGSQKTHKMF